MNKGFAIVVVVIPNDVNLLKLFFVPKAGKPVENRENWNLVFKQK